MVREQSEEAAKLPEPQVQAQQTLALAAVAAPRVVLLAAAQAAKVLRVVAALLKADLAARAVHITHTMAAAD